MGPMANIQKPDTNSHDRQFHGNHILNLSKTINNTSRNPQHPQTLKTPQNPHIPPQTLIPTNPKNPQEKHSKLFN